MADIDLYFETLQERLLDTVRWRVQNGELTERRLAGRVGISQPHMHNLLKGIRVLSPEMADRILRALNMSLQDLFQPGEGPQPAPPPLTRTVLSGPPRTPPAGD